MIVDHYGHPIERFDAERCTGWLDPDGRHIVRSGHDEFVGVPSGTVDVFGRPVMKYDPAIHVRDLDELHLDRLRMTQYRQMQDDDGVESP